MKSILTVSCPICGQGRVPYPFDDDNFGYCRNCGASLETIKWHWNIQCQIGKYALILMVLLFLYALII